MLFKNQSDELINAIPIEKLLRMSTLQQKKKKNQQKLTILNKICSNLNKICPNLNYIERPKKLKFLTKNCY